MTKAKQITVGDLKALLESYDDSTWVNTEGCDCVGPSDGIEVYRGEIAISRNDKICGQCHTERNVSDMNSPVCECPER